MKARIFRYLSAFINLLQFVFSFLFPFAVNLSAYEWTTVIHDIKAAPSGTALAAQTESLAMTLSLSQIILWAMIVLPCLCMILWMITAISERIVFVVQIVSNFVIWAVSVAVIVLSDQIATIVEDLYFNDLFSFPQFSAGDRILNIGFYLGIIITILILIFFSLNRYFASAEGEAIRPIPFTDELPIFNQLPQTNEDDPIHVLRNEMRNDSEQTGRQYYSPNPFQTTKMERAAQEVQTDDEQQRQDEDFPGFQEEYPVIQPNIYTSVTPDIQSGTAPQLSPFLPDEDSNQIVPEEMNPDITPNSYTEQYQDYSVIYPEVNPIDYQHTIAYDAEEKIFETDFKDLHTNNQFIPVHHPEEIGEPVISCVAGLYAGSEFPLQQGESILIGRDVASCHIVFPETIREISRRHCNITFLSEDSGYEVTTLATYGLRVDHHFCKTGDKMVVKRGTEISLDDNQNIFVLG